MSKNKKALIVIFAVLIVLSIIIISTVIIVKRQNDLKARIAFEDRCGIELPSNARIKQFYKDKDRFLAFDIDLNLEARTQLEEAINNTYPPGEWRRELTKDSFSKNLRNDLIQELGWLNADDVRFESGFEMHVNGVLAKTGIVTVVFLRYDNSETSKLIISWYL